MYTFMQGLSETELDLVALYSQLTDQPIDNIIIAALQDFINTVIAAKIESISQNEKLSDTSPIRHCS